MYQLFKDDNINRGTRLDSAAFPATQQFILREMRRITEYYRRSNRVVNNDHLINQLLLHLNVSLHRDIDDYVRVCGFETERLARAFNLINPVVTEPKLHQGTFYHQGVNEFVILHKAEFDYNKAYDKWDTLVPIKVHTHPFTDLTAGIADGNYTNSLSETGYAVISINLPMLALQYRAWHDKVNSKQEYKTQVVDFIYKYPLVNMIHRHMDLAIINRTINHYNDREVAYYKSVHPVAISNYDARLDAILKMRVETLRTHDLKFDELFNIFDGLKRRNWHAIIRPLDIAPVRSVKWVLEIQTLRYFEFFIEVRASRQGRYNSRELSRVERDLQYLENDASYFMASFKELNDRLGTLRKLIRTLK